MDRWSLSLGSLLALLLNYAHFLIKQILVIDVQVTAEVVISAAIHSALNLELVIVTKLKQVLLPLFEAEWGRNFVIYVQFDGFKDDVALHVYHISKPVNKVTSTVNEALSLVKKLTAIASHDNEVTHVIDLEVTHNVSQLEIRNFFLGLEHLLLGLLFLLLDWCTLISARDVVDDFVDEALSEIEVEFGFLFHKHFHVTFVDLFTLNLQELAKIRLSPSAHSLYLALSKRVQDGFGIRINVVD